MEKIIKKLISKEKSLKLTSISEKWRDLLINWLKVRDG